MKKLIFLISIASIVIAACMIYLIKTGISLSPAVLIKPSHFDSESTVVAATVQRLFPQLSEYKRWGVTSDMKSQALGDLIVSEIRKEHNDVALTMDAAFENPQPLQADGAARLYVQRFTRSEFPLSLECENMKRLNSKCFIEVSLHKSRRKIKDDGKKYFLMTSYLDRHFLLLVEE